MEENLDIYLDDDGNIKSDTRKVVVLGEGNDNNFATKFVSQYKAYEYGDNMKVFTSGFAFSGVCMPMTNVICSG